MTGLNFGPIDPDALDRAAQPQQPNIWQPKNRGQAAAMRMLDRQKATDDRVFFADFVEAAKTDPDKAAEVRKLGVDIDGKLDESTIEKHLPDVRRIAAGIRAKRMNLAANSPILRRQLEDPAFARMAHDQVEEMGTIEALFRNWEAGWLQNSIGKLGSAAVGGDLTAEQAQELARLRTEVAKKTNDDAMFFSPAARLVGQISESVPTMLGAGAAGAAVGTAVPVVGPLAGFGYGVTAGLALDSYRVNSGHLFLQMRDQGYSIASSTRAAQMAGIINAGLEVFGGKMVTGTARQFLKKRIAERAGQAAMAPVTVGTHVWTRLRQYAVAGGGETATEIAQEAVNIYEEELARKQDEAAGRVHPETGEPLSSTWTREETADVLIETALEVAQGMAVLGLAGPGFGSFADRKQVTEATQTYKFLEDLQTGVQAQKVSDRSPDLFQNFIQEVAQGKPIQNFQIDTEALQGVLDELGVNAAQLAKDFPEIAEQIESNRKLREKAPEIALDVTIPTARLASDIARRKQLFDALKPHLRAEGQEKSMAELAQEQQDIAEKVAETNRAVDEDLDVHNAEVTAAREIQRDITRRIVAVGKISDDKAAAAAQPIRQFFVRMAAEVGEDPLRFYEKNVTNWEFGDPRKPSANRPGDASTDDPALFQDGQRKTDTPEFREWFGESKVVDESGAPVVVWHGGTVADEFDTSRGESGGAMFGRGAYFGGQGVAEDFVDVRGEGEARAYYLSLKSPYDERSPLAGGQAADPAKAAAFMQALRGLGLRDDQMEGIDAPDAGGLAYVASQLAKNRGIDSWQAGEMVADALRDSGFDGIIAGYEGGSFQYVAFEPTQIKSVNNLGTFDRTDPNILRQDDEVEGAAPRGSYVDRLITIGESANFSTFIHEPAHMFLDIYNQMARRPDAPKVVTEGLQTLIDWMGFEGRTLDDLSKQQYTELHEAFAYNWENWAATGEVASPALKVVFRKFRVWLAALYDSIRTHLSKVYRDNYGKDLPVLTNEVRRVMDRMLASEEQVVRAEQEFGAARRFRTQEESGMDDDAWAEHLETLADAHDEGVDRMSRVNLKSTEFAQKVRDAREREIQQDARATRAAIRADVKPEVAKQRVTRLRKLLRTGVLVNAEGAEVEHGLGDSARLNTEAVREMAPDLSLRTLGGVTSPEGIAPEVVAGLFGYTTPMEMLRELATTPTTATLVDREVQARMDREYPELTDPEIIEATVQEAVHNESRMMAISQELAAVSKSPGAIELAAAKRVARERIEQTEIRDLRPDLVKGKEIRARREALNLLRKGDREGAASAMRREMVYAYMAQEAYAAKAEIAQKRQGLRKFFVGNEKIAKVRETNIVNVARSVLAWAGLGPASKSPNEWVRELELYEPEVAETLRLELDRARRDAVDDFRKLTLFEFRRTVEIADNLWEQSRRAKQVEIAGRLYDQDTAAAELRAQFERTNPARERLGETASLTKKQKRWHGLTSWLARYRRVEHFAYANDGGKKGAIWKYLVKPVFDAINTYKTRRAETTKMLSSELRKLQLPRGTIEAPDLNYTFGIGQQSGMAEVLGALMNAGTKSSLNRLIGAEKRKWGEVDEDGNADPSRFWDTVQSLLDSGKLTEEHLDFVQLVWDTNESIKPLMQRAAKVVTGFFAKELEAQSFTVTLPDGREKTYRGGYSPATYDAIISKHGRRIADQTEVQNSENQSRINLTPSFVKERVEGFKDVIDLDIRRAVMNFDNVLRWAHIAPSVRDVQSLLMREDVGEYLKTHKPGTIENLMIPWLQRAITQSTFKKNDEADGWLVKMRTGVGSSIMAGNYPNAAQQLAGFFLSGTRISKPKLLAGIALAKTPTVNKFILDSSEMMRHRKDSGIQELSELMHQLFDKPGMFNDANAFLKRHAYFLQQGTQGFVDQGTWIAAYNDYQAKHTAGIGDDAAHADAVEHADGVVRMSQGSLDPEDVPAYERATALTKLFTQFGSYFNTLANLAADEYILKVRSVGGLNVATSARLIYAWMGVVVAPAIAAEIIMMTMKGDWWEDDEEDGMADEAAQILWWAPAKTAVAMAPFPANQLAMAAVNALDPTPWNDRMLQAPAVTTLESFVMRTMPQWMEGDVKARQARDVGMVAAMLTGSPLGAIGATWARAARLIKNLFGE